MCYRFSPLSLSLLCLVKGLYIIILRTQLFKFPIFLSRDSKFLIYSVSDRSLPTLPIGLVLWRHPVNIHLEVYTITLYSTKSYISLPVITHDQMNLLFLVHLSFYLFTASYVTIGGHLWLLRTLYNVATMCSGLMNSLPP